jgi:hypothetical protein
MNKLPESDVKYLQGFEDGAKHERDRIVGLFDEAAKTIDDETDYEAYAYDARVEAKLLESATRIIEGLRVKK